MAVACGGGEAYGGCGPNDPCHPRSSLPQDRRRASVLPDAATYVRSHSRGLARQTPYIKQPNLGGSKTAPYPFQAATILAALMMSGSERASAVTFATRLKTLSFFASIQPTGRPAI